MITRIRNGQKAGLLEIALFWPQPKVCFKVLALLQKEGYIRGLKKVILKNKECYFVLLKYTEFQVPVIKKIERISKPGKRIYCASKNLWKVQNGKGCFIISSPKGLITDIQARFLNVGGEILCYIE